MYLRLLVIALFIFVSCSEKKNDKPIINVDDKIELSELSQQGLNDLIANYTDKMTKPDELEVNDYIVLVKMFNTIAYNKLWHLDTLYGNFSKLYFLNINKKSREVLGAEKTEGGMWYSKKYDMYIGNPEHEKSRFNLTDMNK